MPKYDKHDPTNKLYCPCCGEQNCDTADIAILDSDQGETIRIDFECFNCSEPICMSVEVVDPTNYTDMVVPSQASSWKVEPINKEN